MAFTALITSLFEIVDHATAGTGGRTRQHRITGVRAEGCDRENIQEQIVSNDVSLLSLALSPIGLVSNTASNLLMFLYANQPVDLRFGTSGTVLSSVRSIAGTWSVSALFVTTGSNAARVVLGIVGGSGASIQTTID